MIYFSLERTLIVTTQFLRYALFVYLIYQIFTRAFKREVLIWTIWDWNIICPGFVFRIWSTACAWKWLLRVFVVCSMNAAIMCEACSVCLLFSHGSVNWFYLWSICSPTPPPPPPLLILSYHFEGDWKGISNGLIYMVLYCGLPFSRHWITENKRE